MLQHSLCMIQWYQRNYLNGIQNIALLLVFFMTFTWCLTQKFITWKWVISINHLHFSAVIHFMNLLSTMQRWKNLQQNKGRKKRAKTSCSSKINMCFLVQRKHCMAIHSGTLIQRKNSLKKMFKTNFIKPWLQNIYRWNTKNTKSLIWTPFEYMLMQNCQTTQ